MSKYVVQVEFNRMVASDIQEAIRLAYEKFRHDHLDKPVGLLLHPVALKVLKPHYAGWLVPVESPSALPQYMGMAMISNLACPLYSVFVVSQVNFDRLLATMPPD
jgi:hypothetical protein